MVGDSEGGLYVLDHEGQVLSSRSGRTVIAAIVPSRANQLTAIHRSGEMVLVDSTALRKNVLSRTLRSVSYALNGVWAVLLLVTAIHAVDRWRMKTLRLLRRISRSWQSYIFLLPSFILIFLFRYFAIEMGLFYSFTNYIPGNPVRVVGLANYVNIFTRDHAFWAGMGNMTLILVTSIIKVLTIPLLVALLVFRVRNPKAQYRWRVAFVIPTVVPGIVMVMMWRMMYDPHNGFMNALLQAIGLPHWRQAWLGNEKTALWSIIFAGFPWVSAFAFLIYSGGLVNINPELFDAGAIDGVGWWERFRFLEWPLLSPQRSLLLFFTFLSSMQGYADIFVYTQGGPGTATTVPALQIFLSLSVAMRAGYSSALGLILFCIVLFFTVLNRRISRSAAVSF